MKPKFLAPRQVGNNYCGPAAISALTGVTSKRAAQIIRQASGRARIRATYTSELHRSLLACGFTVESLIVRNSRVGKLTEDPGVYVVLYRTKGRKGHYVVIKDGMMTDSYRCRTPGPIPQDVSLLPVVWAVRVSEGSGDLPAPPVKKTTNRWWVKTMKLAKEHGVTVEEVDSVIWVYRPASFPCDKDTYADQHYHYSWEEAFKAVTYYSSPL